MKLYIKQKVFSWNDKFSVKGEDEQDLYYVEGEFFSWGKKLHVFDKHHNEVAFIRQKLMSWLPRYTVEIDGREICHIVKSFTFFKQRYELDGLPWHVEGDFWAHEYTVLENTREVMRMSKHWFTWGDSYELDVQRDEDGLLCLCVMLAIDAAMASAQAAGSAST